MEPGQIEQSNLNLPGALRGLKIEWSHFAALTFLTSLAAITAHNIPLGHDESIYALRGHDLRSGYSYLSGDYWRDYRAPGLSFIDSWLFDIFGENDFVARLPSMFFGIILFGSTYLLAKELFGRRISQIATVLFVSTPPLVENSAILLADVPGSSVAIFCVFSVFYLQRVRTNLFLVLLVIFVLGSIATVLRFGSFITYGPGIFAASLYFFLANVHKAHLPILLLKQVVIQLVSLFSFSWIYFTHVTSINGKTPFEANSQFAEGAGVTPINGLIDLIELTYPFSDSSQWVNPFFGLLILASFCFAIFSLFSRSAPQLETISVLVAGILSLSLLIVGVRYVQGNYLALSAPYWVIISAAALDVYYQNFFIKYEPNLNHMFRLRVIPVGVGILLIFLPINYLVLGYANSNLPRFGLRSAGDAIRYETSDDRCLVISTYPESAWYSKCLLGIWIGTTKDKPKLGVTDNDFNQVVNSSIAAMNREKWKEMRNNQELVTYRKFVVLVTNGKRQPTDESIQADRITLLEKQFTTDRVFYAEVNSDSISAP